MSWKFFQKSSRWTMHCTLASKSKQSENINKLIFIFALHIVTKYVATHFNNVDNCLDRVFLIPQFYLCNSYANFNGINAKLT